MPQRIYAASNADAADMNGWLFELLRRFREGSLSPTVLRTKLNELITYRIPFTTTQLFHGAWEQWWPIMETDGYTTYGIVIDDGDTFLYSRSLKEWPRAVDVLLTRRKRSRFRATLSQRARFQFFEHPSGVLGAALEPSWDPKADYLHDLRLFVAKNGADLAIRLPEEEFRFGGNCFPVDDGVIVGELVDDNHARYWFLSVGEPRLLLEGQSLYVGHPKETHPLGVVFFLEKNISLLTPTRMETLYEGDWEGTRLHPTGMLVRLRPTPDETLIVLATRTGSTPLFRGKLEYCVNSTFVNPGYDPGMLAHPDGVIVNTKREKADEGNLTLFVPGQEPRVLFRGFWKHVKADPSGRCIVHRVDGTIIRTDGVETEILYDHTTVEHFWIHGNGVVVKRDGGLWLHEARPIPDA